MRGNRRRDTRPELALRSALHRLGLRFRVDQLVEAEGIKVRPDIVFPRRRVAVFVDGCFWHVCPSHGTRPAANGAYWAPKLRRNQERDLRVNDRLTAAGWEVIRVWEHEPIEDAATMVAAKVARRSRRG